MQELASQPDSHTDQEDQTFRRGQSRAQSMFLLKAAGSCL